jgi:hypothetical protein
VKRGRKGRKFLNEGMFSGIYLVLGMLVKFFVL